MKSIRTEIYIGDCRESLRRMAADGVRAQTCVTSPPYYGLRDYGVDGQLGLEQTPDEYVQHMVEVFRAVRDVLADDGTLWLNLGDSYAANQSNNGGCSPKSTLGGGGGKYREGSKNESAYNSTTPRKINHGLKQKDLIGIPWRVAFALQADGWHLRQDIIWHKPNPMPESVRDRCTKAHEYIFLLSKSPRYFFDHEAIKEPAIHAGVTVKSRGKYDDGTGKAIAGYETHVVGERLVADKRNRRSVWTVATRPYKGAHFATFPPALIEPCILAGSRPGDIVLDPFGGSGTTSGVAILHGRSSVLCEINPKYAALVPDRVLSIAGFHRPIRPYANDNDMSAYIDASAAFL